MKSKELIQAEITAGEALATKLKNYFYADQAWDVKLAFNIGHLMNHVKKAGMRFYADKDSISVLHSLTSYSKPDLKEFMDAQKIIM